jgi:hypothetical protein
LRIDDLEFAISKLQFANGQRERPMSELDEAWMLALAEAERRARAAGKSDVLDYLALRNSNDLLRQTGITWLMEIFMSVAAEANRSGASVQVSRDDSHRFKSGNSTMVGRLLTLRNGVRNLFIEAGWPRQPRDGFVSGGGLARGNIRHLGFKSADAELLLTKSQTGVPVWLILGPRGDRSQLHESIAKTQLQILLNDSRTR